LLLFRVFVGLNATGCGCHCGS